MNDSEAGQYWEQNAEAWTRLSRQGYDVYRDLLNTPAFMEMLPPVDGLTGLDLGCGEGHNTRLLTQRGAQMVGIDIAPTFIGYARGQEPNGCYAAASAQCLPFPGAAFDFITAYMSLMDMPDPDAALREAWRVLKPRGFVQFSIAHPCFNPPHRKLLRDERREAYAVQVGRYFEDIHGQIDQWLFSAAPAAAKEGLHPFQVPQFHRPLSAWLNAVVDSGFQIERVAEPSVDAGTAARFPAVADTRVVAYFLHVRGRKAR
jgi:ubiquinone/menaquinone biosynthesis C-methylase UbiE